MRSRLTLTIAVLVIAVVVTALCVAANILPIWAVLVVVLVLAAPVALVASKRISDARYTFLTGVGGGIAAFIVYLAVPIAIRDDSSLISGALQVALAIGVAIGAGVISGRRQHQKRRGALGVTTAAVASTLIAAAFSVAIAVVTILVYASIACSHYVNSCPFD